MLGFSLNDNYSVFVFTSKTIMAMKPTKPPNLVLRKADANEDQTMQPRINEDSLQEVKEGNKLESLKPPSSPLSKRWFRKQFGIRRSKAQFDDNAQPQTLSSSSFPKNRRRSSSLPDLAEMLDAASKLSRHSSFNSRSSVPVRTSEEKESIVAK